jgi:hypothetical protein
VKTLSSKVFDTAGNGGIDALCRAFREFLLPFAGRPGTRAVVRIEEAGKDRARKKTALRQLEELLAGGGEAPCTWEEHGYRFDFTERKYFRDGREIHVTANEALFLYRWLVLRGDVLETQAYYLWNMRRRLGKEFLAEAAG